MAKGATSKSKTKNEENRKREEEQQKQQTTQKRADSKPRRTQTAETEPTTQEAAPKPTSTQIPTLEPKYASPEQIEEARNIGRRSLEMARSGQIRDESPIQYGVRGIAEQYDIPKVEETPSTTMPSNKYAPQTRQNRAEQPSYGTSERDYMMQQNATRNEQRRAERQPVDILGSRLGAGQSAGMDKYSEKMRPESSFDVSTLSEKDARRFEKLNNSIARISSRMARNGGSVEDQRALSALQAEKAKIMGQNLVSDEANADDVISEWLDPDYKMGRSEVEQAKQIIQDYENNEYKNSNIYDLTDEESAKLSQINALRDKVSKAESAIYGMENATINPLMVAADRDFYGWTVDDLRDEVARQRDLPMSPEVRAYVNQLQGEIDALQSQLDNADTVYSTGDAGVDEVIGSNTQSRNAAELRRDIEDKQAQMYKLMLEESRGNNEPNYDSYSLRKANAQKQNPVPYLAGDMGTRMLESMAIQGAVGDNGFAADMLVDALTDTAPEYLANRAGGMSRKDAGNQALISAALNTAMDTGAWAAQNADEVASMFRRGDIPSLNNVDEAVDATKQELNPLELAKQNEVDVNAKVDNVNQTVDEINDLAEQIPEAPVQPIEQAARNVEAIPTTPNDIANFEAQRQQLFDEIDDAMARGEDPSMYYGELSDLENDMYKAHPELFDPETSSYVGLPKESVSSATPKVEAEAEPETPFSIEGTNLEWLKNDIDTLTMPKDVRADLKSKYSQYENIYRNLGKAESADEITNLLRQQEVLHEDIKKILQENAGYPAAQKGKYDDITRSFVDSLNGMRINVPDHVRSELPDAKINDLNKHFSFSEIGNNGKRNYLDFKLSQRGGVPVDTVFADIDNATGHALSSFMERQGLNPDVTENQILGLIEYADYLKSDYFKNTQTLIPYDTSKFRDLARETIDRGRSQLDRIQAQSIKAVDEVADAVPASTVTNNAPAMPDLPKAEEQSLDAIPNGSDLPPVNNPTKDLGFDPNDPYVPDPNAIRNNSIPTVDNPKTKNSKLGTNTMRTLDGDEANAEDLSRGLYSYVPKEEQETMRVAAKRVAESQNKSFNEILNTADDAFTAEDVDTSMMLRNKIKQDLASARESGDERAINYLQSQLDALTIRQRKAATNAGQVSQAWAKWSRDADGATFASYNIAARQYEDAIKNNPRLGEEANSIAESISDNIARITSKDISNESVDALSEEIQNMIKSVVDKEGNYRIRRNFRDANIKKLSDTLATELKQGDDIGQTLEMIERAGVTGFTGLDDSVEAEIRELFDRAELFGYNSKQRVQLEDQAYARLAQALNLTGGIYDKIDAVRYFAMLANPKTHLRNVIGNYTFGEITNFKDQLAGILEEAVDRASLKKGARAAERGVELKHGGQGIDRTTAFIRKNGADRNLYQAARDDFDNYAYRELVGDKWISSEKSIEGNKNVFGYGKVGSVASDTVESNAKLLEAEDIIGKQNKYADSLTRYLKANGYDESILKADVTDRKTLEFLDEARQYAIDQAQKATFNQQNVVADTLSKFSREARDIKWSDASAGARGKKLAGLFLDATVPFKRTPLNIVTSLWEYTPVHIAKIGTDIVDIARHKPKAVNTLIDDIAKNLTGVGMLGAGYALAANGFITGRKDKETGDLDDLTGKQDYSLNLGNLGSYTLDWLSPSLTIMLAGANLFQSGLTADGLSQMISDIGEPVLETTMLSSLVDVLRSAQYAEDPMDTVKQTVATAAKNYVSQFVPSELGNIARSIDNTRRSTYTDKTGVAGIADRTLRGIVNKLPVLSENNQPYINRWGDEEQNVDGAVGDNVLSRFAYNHLSPGYYSPEEVTPKDDYLYNLNERLPQPDEKLFPPAFSTNIKEDGVTRKVTPEEKTVKDKAEGQARGDFVTAVSRNPEILALSPELQASIVKDLYGVAEHIGRDAILDDYATDDKSYNIYVNSKNDIPTLLDYEIAKYNPYGISADLYQEIKANGGDFTPYEGYREAQEKYGIDDKKAYREAYTSGGEEALADEVEYQNAIAENNLNDSKEVRMAWDRAMHASADPIAALQNLAQNRDAAQSAGFVNADGTANTTNYNNAIAVLGDNETALSQYAKLQSDIADREYTKQADYIPYVIEQPGSTTQKGQYMMLLAGDTPDDISSKSAASAYDNFGYEGYYYYRILQNAVKDYNNDGKVNKYDRIQRLYEDGYSQGTDYYNLFVDLSY
jgi:hypothetical protein